MKKKTIISLLHGEFTSMRLLMMFMFSIRYLRHPSYTGFFYWGIFMQLSLANPICTVGYAYALHHFFASRIESEEHALIEFFGDEYRKYRQSAHIYIPRIH